MLLKIRHSLGVIIIIVAISMLVWGEWQFPREVKIFPVNFPEIQLSENNINNGSITAANSTQNLLPTPWHLEENPGKTSESLNYQLIIDAPSKVRVGDSEIIRLDLVSNFSEVEGKSTADQKEEIQSSAIIGLPIISIYNILVETRLDLDGILFSPAGDVIKSFRPGQIVRFYWTIEPEREGVFQGMLWLHSQYVSKDGNVIRKLLSTQKIECSAIGFFGLSSDFARLLGSLGFFVGLAFELDLIICFISKTNSNKGKPSHA